MLLSPLHPLLSPLSAPSPPHLSFHNKSIIIYISSNYVTLQSPASPAAPSPNANEEETFESLYLRQMTKEFADDIDAVRQAPDFHGQASLDVLVAALKQGVEVYPEEFREEYMRVWRQGGGGGEVRNAM